MVEARGYDLVGVAVAPPGRGRGDATGIGPVGPGGAE
jgi:hypothetical protein